MNQPKISQAITSSHFSSAAKGDFWATDPEAVVHIARILESCVVPGVQILDPSCGKGSAVCDLAERLHGRAFGNEINSDRFDEAKKILTKATHGAAETLEIPDRAVPFTFCNPPYNQNETGGRLEIDHAEQALKWTSNNGINVLVLPRKILANVRFWMVYLNYITDYEIYEMCGKDFSRFHQYIIIGFTPRWGGGYSSSYRYRHHREAQSQAAKFAPDVQRADVPRITHADPLDKPSKTAPNPSQFAMRNRMPNAEEYINALAEAYPDPFHTPRYLALTEPRDEIADKRPVTQVSNGLLMHLASCGGVQGRDIEYEGQSLYWTGSWRRFEHKKETTDEDGNKTILTQEDVAYMMRGIDLSTGRYIVLDSEKTKDKFNAFLDNQTQALMQAVEDTYNPRYDLDYGHLVPYFDQIHSPRVLEGKEDGLFVPQKHIVAAAWQLLHDHCGDRTRPGEANPHFFLSGEMGTGKSPIATAIMAIVAGHLDGRTTPVVVMAPAGPITKWKEEIENVLRDVPNLGVFIIGTQGNTYFCPHRPRGFRDALILQQYRALEARMQHGARNLDAKNAELAKVQESDHQWHSLMALYTRCFETGAPEETFLEVERQIENSNWIQAADARAQRRDEIADAAYWKAVEETRAAATPKERARFRALQQICAVGTFSKKDRRRIESHERRPPRERVLKEGTGHTYLGRADKQSGWSAKRHIERYGKTIVPTYQSTRKGSHRMPIRDLERAMAHDGPKWLLVSMQNGKAGSKWVHVTRQKRETKSYKEKHKVELNGKNVTVFRPVTREMYTNYCPDCGQLLYDRETEKPWEIGKGKDCELSLTSQYKRMLHCNNEVRKWNDVDKKWEMVPCNAPLMTYVPYSYGGRWPVCRYLREFYTDQYCAIIDESHEAKGLDTNIGAASQDLIQGAQHVVAMTGTESNGYTKSVFSTLFRLDWRFRELYGYSDQQLFVDHYGMVETRTVIPSEKSRTSGAGYSSSVSVTKDEMPGASPALIKLMAPLTAWVSMEDMGIALPPRLEYVVPIELPEELTLGWNVLCDMKQSAIRMYPDGNQGPMSRWLGAAKAWLDCPNDEDIKSLGTISKVDPPEGGFPKDQQIVNMVLENLNEDRGCCIFCEQVNRRDFRPRLVELLKSEGVHTAVVNRDDAPPDGRMELIRAKVQEMRRKGQEPVILLNGSLVKVGVELLDFPTMIETGIEFNVLTLQQRARRSWRIGQNREVRIYYLYYEDTYQEDALLLVASKLAAMASLKGNVATGLAAMSGTSSAIQALLRSANEMDHRSLADMMQTATFNKRPILRSPIVNSAPQEIIKPVARILVPPTEVKVSSRQVTDTVEQLALF